MALPIGPITTQMDLSGLRSLANPQRVAQGVLDGMPRVAELLVPAMRAEMTHPDGPGARSLTSRVVEDGRSASIEILGNSYLKYNLRDTKPHVIEARNALALRFTVEGGTVIFRRRVNHPGTKANRWDLRAWAKVRGEAVQVLAQSLIRRLVSG